MAAIARLACATLVVAAGLSTSPALAGALLADLADRSIACAAGAPYYISPGAKTLSTLIFPDTTDAQPRDVSVQLVAPALDVAQADRVKVVLPGVEGVAKSQRLIFKRTLEPPEKGAASRKPRIVISLHVDADDVGDECVVERGRKAFVADRFNVIREMVCGNDPAPTCERLLEKTCGAELTVACAVALRPELDAVTKTYFDRLNAKAGKGKT